MRENSHKSTIFGAGPNHTPCSAAWTMQVKLKSGATVDEAGLIAWANTKVDGKAAPMAGFQDKALSDSVFLLHMLDGVRPGESWLTAAIPIDNPYCSCKLTGVFAETVDWAEVAAEGADDEAKHSNATYLIALARKMGCKIFLTWEE